MGNGKDKGKISNFREDSESVEKTAKYINRVLSFYFTDYQSKSIIDILKDRSLYSFTEYFSRFL